MNWPLKTPAVSESQIPILNSYYLKACPTPADPTMVWGTDVPMTSWKEYLRRMNAYSPVLISGAHVLLRAIGVALKRHPKFNRRVLGGRVYRFRDVNVMMPLQKRREQEADVFLLKNVDSLSVVDIARQVWEQAQRASRGESAYQWQERMFRYLPRRLATWFLRWHLWSTNHWNRPINAVNEQLRSAAVLVNYLAFHGAAPMQSFKPSRFPSDCWTLSVTLGPAEERPVAEGGRVRVRPVASLYVRADHRIVDAYQLGQFVGTLRQLLTKPWQLDEQPWPEPEPASVTQRMRSTASLLYCRWPQRGSDIAAIVSALRHAGDIGQSIANVPIQDDDNPLLSSADRLPVEAPDEQYGQRAVAASTRFLKNTHVSRS